jgi:hypothetical protein
MKLFQRFHKADTPQQTVAAPNKEDKAPADWKRPNEKLITFWLSNDILQPLDAWCRSHRYRRSFFIRECLVKELKSLTAQQQQTADPQPTPPPQHPARRSQERVTVPAWLTKQADPDPAAPPPPKADPAPMPPSNPLMEQWKKEQELRQNDIQAEYEKETGKKPPKQEWLPQQPNRWRR